MSNNSNKSKYSNNNYYINNSNKSINSNSSNKVYEQYHLHITLTPSHHYSKA